MAENIEKFQLASPIAFPPHLYRFADQATTLLTNAHEHGLHLDGVSVRTSEDYEARRLFIEREAEYHLDRELLAIHLAKSAGWLSVSFSHSRRTMADLGYQFPQSSVVIESAGAQVHNQNNGRIGPSEHITGDEVAGKRVTHRLIRSFGSMGIYNDDQMAHRLNEAS